EDQGAGTAFVMDAGLLSDAWSTMGDVLVTNEHVISPIDQYRLHPKDAMVRFTQVDDKPVPVGDVIWWSSRQHHDITICKLDNAPAGVQTLREIAPTSWLRRSPNEFHGVTVVGHHMGTKALRFGINNLKVEDAEPEDGTGEPKRLLYQSPTQEGG